MNREELGRAIKAACANLDEPRVIVLGSQSILGSFDTDELPPATFLSREVDILPLSGITDPPSVEDKLLLLDARLGEDSPFHTAFGFYVEGIHKDVVVLPTNWGQSARPLRCRRRRIQPVRPGRAVSGPGGSVCGQDDRR